VCCTGATVREFYESRDAKPSFWKKTLATLGLQRSPASASGENETDKSVVEGRPEEDPAPPAYEGPVSYDGDDNHV
jgi:hypothetical protein